MNFLEAADSYIATLNQPRRRGVLRETSQRLYRSYALRCTEIIGDVPCGEIHNSTMKLLIAALRNDDLAPATIVGHFQIACAVLDSVEDQDGNPLFSQKFNLTRIGLPVIGKQNQPCATRQDVEKGVSRNGWLGAWCAFAAGSGLRLSEIEAVMVNAAEGGDAYLPQSGVIKIRKTLKTPASERDVLLPENLAAFMHSYLNGRTTGKLFPQSRSAVHKSLNDWGLPSPHAFRRFYVTVRRSAGMNESVLAALVGHAKGDVTSRYDFTRNNSQLIAAEVTRCGLGFSLPEAFTARDHPRVRQRFDGSDRAIEIPVEVAA